MSLGDRGSRSRCLLVWASGSSTLAVVVLLAGRDVGRLWRARASLGAVPLDVALVEVAACVVVACAVWAWLALTATVVEAWRGVGATRRRPWHLPEGVRRAVLAACGVALASGVTAPSWATDLPSHRHRDGRAALSGLPLPDRAVEPHRSPLTTAVDGVVVRPGESLWSIAARDLGPGAPDRAIARRWRAIYTANRHVVGPDPDVVEPGQRLHLPGKDRP